ncbi:MAG: hypothetical protein KAS66_08445 [Candidatus Omnitrophica bacterium]|nr:hypothetical protein [Candidatus Omnitrophota bacterium]
MYSISIPVIIIIFGLTVFFIMKNRVVLALLILVPFIYVLMFILSLPSETYNIVTGEVVTAKGSPLFHFFYLSAYYFFLASAVLALDISKSKKRRRR